MLISYPYKLPNSLPNKVTLVDHLNGFDQHLHNPVLKHLDTYCVTNNARITVNYHQVLDSQVQALYPNLDFNFDLTNVISSIWYPHAGYTQHPEIQYKNFLCSFNGSDHVSRKLLVAILERFGYFDCEYCSKNFVFATDKLDGHITDYVQDQDSFYRKFFISDNSKQFFQTVNSFGHGRFDHANNIYNLESKLTESFLHIVSETMATGYYPFVTEKFLYSIVTRGLFLAYAQPGWHAHLEKYYGFRRYTKLFDYRFDSIQNPVERLVELMSMISKFSVLSVHDWHDLYLVESDSIEYNYNHYFSGDYLKHLEKHAV
jgi:hypothetical protein